jgi:hypothetical protein
MFQPSPRETLILAAITFIGTLAIWLELALRTGGF